jgi:peptidoglycan/LPS O-acetylase OafA/YrhL
VLIGHPLLILALARMAGGRNTGRWLLLGLGVIGQISIVNTFTHLHTPLAVSIERTLQGLWAGALMGALLYLVVESGERAWGAWRGASDTDG